MKPARNPGRTALAAALTCTLASSVASAQMAAVPPGAPPAAAFVPTPKEKPGALSSAAGAVKKWFEKIKIGGYTQLRYNQLGATNERLVNAQGDRSIGKDGGFLFRRARLVIQGDVHERVFIYLQPDFATIVGDQLHVPTMRDWYADIALDEDKEFRFRVGQSKVPFGFENMQSSSNRAPLDRADATNSSFRDERELGVFYYYAPKQVRALYKELANAEMKGSGDYGIVGLGIFNGQGANKLENNATPHAVARVTYPFRIGRQIIEPGVAGYYGRYVVKADEGIQVAEDYRDMRVMGSLIIYPQPIGLQLEYNIGRGPELSGARVVERPLHGGYATVIARIGDFTPYVRFSRYRGGRKFETNAPRYKVDEVELGVEWRPFKALELVGAYAFAERTFPEPPYQQESGRLLRLQLQFNY
ncbi:MAG TPA: porin [Candidatus Nanopelagicales bacterium]|nr:porin [Candidatus Nanopelagicales bacterium]